MEVVYFSHSEDSKIQAASLIRKNGRREHLFGRFLKHSENATIKKKDIGRERERQPARTLERKKENVQIKQKITNDDWIDEIINIIT